MKINLIAVIISCLIAVAISATDKDPDGSRTNLDAMPDYDAPDAPDILWTTVPYFPGFNASSPSECAEGNRDCAEIITYPGSFIWSPKWIHGFKKMDAVATLRQCNRADSHMRAVCLGRKTEESRIHHQFVVMDTFITPEGLQGVGFALPGMSDLMTTNVLALTLCIVRHGSLKIKVKAKWEFIQGSGLRGFSFHCPVRFPTPVNHVTVELSGPVVTLEPMVPVMPPVREIDKKWWTWPRREPGQPQLRAVQYKKKHPKAHPNSIAMAPVRIGGCAGNLFDVDPRVLIQWIEYHRLIGVSTFVLYPLFSNQLMWSDIVSAYADDPEITVIVVSFSQVLKFRGIGNFQQPIASMHCRFILRGLADHVLLFDPDELVAPTSARVEGIEPGAHPREWISLPNDVLSWESQILPGDRLTAILRPVNFFGRCVTSGIENVDDFKITDTSPGRFSIAYLRERCDNMLWWYDEDRNATKPSTPWSTWPESTRKALCGNNLKILVDVLIPYVMRSNHEVRDTLGRPLRSISPDGWILNHYRNVTSHWPCGFGTMQSGKTNHLAYPASSDSFDKEQTVDCFGLKEQKMKRANLGLKELQCDTVQDDTMLVFTPFMKAQLDNHKSLWELWQKIHSINRF